MKKNEKEFEIEKLVFRVFMKHVKANNLYIAFRWSVNRENPSKDMIHNLSNVLCRRSYNYSRDMMCRIGGTAFANSRSITDILNIMHAESGKCKGGNARENQIRIMNMVNMLIHNCIEHALTNNMQLIEKIGSAIFEEVGKKIFGEDFKDLTNEGIDPQQLQFMEQMRELGGFNEMPTQEMIRRIQQELRHRLAERRNITEGNRTTRGLYVPNTFISPLEYDNDLYELEDNRY